jgi:hypothetical protein
MSRRTAPAGLLVAALIFSAAPPIHADASLQDRAAADALYEEAGKLIEANRWADACPKLEASLKLDPGIGTLLRLGYCYERTGRTASSWSSFNEATAMATKANDKRAKVAAEGVKRLEPTLSRITIEVAPENAAAGLEVRRDGTVIHAGAFGTPVPVDPGVHAFEATQPGKQKWTTTITVEPKPGVTTVRIPALQDAPPEDKGAAGSASPWGPQRVAGVAVGGVGLVGVIVGGIFGGLTLSKSGSSKAHCNAAITICDATGVDLQQTARTTAHAADAALGLGAAMLVTGVVVFLTAPSSDAVSAPRRRSWVRLRPTAGLGVTGASVQGAW